MGRKRSATGSSRRREKAQMETPSLTAAPNDERQWTATEENALVDAIQRSDGQSWGDVAQIAKLNRSAAACRIHFQRAIRKKARFRGHQFKTPRGEYLSKPAVDASTNPVVSVIDKESLFADEFLDAVDAFTLESIMNLGAQPHLKQPVVQEQPSPTAVAGLPKWTKQSPPLPPSVRAACVPEPVGGLSVRVVQRKHLAYRPDGSSSSVKLFAMGDSLVRVSFASINQMLKTPPKHKPKVAPKAPVQRMRKIDGLVFNTALVAT